MQDLRENITVQRQPLTQDRMKQRLLLLLLAAGMSLALTILCLVNPEPTPATSAPVPRSLGAWSETAMDVLTHTAFLPLVANGLTPNLSVDPQDRQASMDVFNRVYRASEDVLTDWTGSHAACDTGTTADAFRYAVQLRINYFRAMAACRATSNPGRVSALVLRPQPSRLFFGHRGDEHYRANHRADRAAGRQRLSVKSGPDLPVSLGSYLGMPSHLNQTGSVSTLSSFWLRLRRLTPWSFTTSIIQIWRVASLSLSARFE
jgi:hypothetical protein